MEPDRYPAVRGVYIRHSEARLIEEMGSARNRRRSLAIRCLVLSFIIQMVLGRSVSPPPYKRGEGGYRTAVSFSWQFDRLQLFLCGSRPGINLNDMYRSALHSKELRERASLLMLEDRQVRKLLTSKIYEALSENRDLDAFGCELVLGAIGEAHPAQGDQPMPGNTVRSLSLRQEDVSTLADIHASRSKAVQGTILATGLYLLGGGSIPEVFFNEDGGKRSLSYSCSMRTYELSLEIEVVMRNNLSRVIRSALLTPDIVAAAKQMAVLPKHEKRELAVKVREGLKEKERLSA